MFLQFSDVQADQQGLTRDQLAAKAQAATLPSAPTTLPQPTTTQTQPQGLQMPSGYSASTPTVAAPAQVAPIPTQAQTYAPAANYTGNSITDFLSQAGQPSDFNSRAKLAAQYGISGYSGTAAQNTQLLGILKSHATGNVSSVGVPNNIGTILGSPTVPTANTSIPATGLSTTNSSDVNSVLSSYTKNGTLDSQTAGLLGLMGASTSADQSVNDINNQITKAMSSLGNEGTDLQTALDTQGVGAAYDQVKQLNLKGTQLKAQIDAFDAETAQGNSSIQDIGDKNGVAGIFVAGDQARYQKQRDLTKASMAADLAATAALAQAYQGNAELGTQLAQQSIDLKYDPIKNQITVLQQQLSAAKDTQNTQDQSRNNVITALLNIKSKEVDNEVADKKAIQTLAVQAASNGAPLSIVNQMQTAGSQSAAASIGAKWIKGNLEKAGGSGPGTTPVDKGVQFTQDDVQRLISVGLNTTDIKNMQADINTHGIDAVIGGLNPTQQTAVRNILSGVTPTQANSAAADAKQFLTPDYFKSFFGQDALEQAAKDAGFTTKTGGGFLGTGLWASKAADTQGYLDNLMQTVNSYRQAGYTDKEIFDIIQKQGK